VTAASLRLAAASDHLAALRSLRVLADTAECPVLARMHRDEAVIHARRLVALPGTRALRYCLALSLALATTQGRAS
jgi:hypothetical protein